MLTTRQRELLDRWLPGAVTVRDHSWGLVGTTVLELRHDGRRYIAKAGDDADKHIARELCAHRRWLAPWTSRGRAPSLVHADDDAKLIVTAFLPGDLLLDHPRELDPDVHRQAGALLAELHGQCHEQDGGYEARAKEKIREALDRPHHIAPDVEARLRDEIAAWPTPAVTLVPTHGDWHPRNWLLDGDEVKVIDFGRAEMRPADTDLVRLSFQQFRTEPALWDAFLEGYGADPREPGAWRRRRMYEAVATATWAPLVGDERFEQQGLRMVAEVLADG